MNIYTLTVYNTVTKQLEEVEVTEEVYTAFKRYFENMTSFVEVCDSHYRESISQIELHQILAKALNTLPADDRKLIEALFYEGYSDKAYADKLGVSKQYIGQIKQRILSNLRKELEKSLA